MKRMFALMVVLMLLGGAMADTGIDWSDYPDESLKSTIEELQEMLNEANAELSRRSGNEKYEINGIEFSVEFYRQTIEGAFKNMQDCILVKIDWTNKTQSATSFIYSLIAHGYQSGKEMHSFYGDSYGFGDKENEDILPGYSATTFVCLKLKDDSDVKVIISDLFHQGNTEKGKVFDIKPSQFKEYK